MHTDTIYRLGIMLEADKLALANERNRLRAKAIFAAARETRRQLREA